MPRLLTSAKSAQNGMTLIELMIVVSILTILAVLVIPEFKQTVANSQIRGAAESIQSGLQLARLEAIRRNTIIKFDIPVSSGTAWSYG
ncbi:MAG: GspH/FimT family pseudopilin, partial [Methylophilaceae bacterium]